MLNACVGSSSASSLRAGLRSIVACTLRAGVRVDRGVLVTRLACVSIAEGVLCAGVCVDRGVYGVASLGERPRVGLALGMLGAVVVDQPVVLQTLQ